MVRSYYISLNDNGVGVIDKKTSGAVIHEKELIERLRNIMDELDKITNEKNEKAK